jgi:hypothetical protein
MSFGYPDDVCGYEAQDPAQNKSDNRQKDKARQFGADELLNIADPLVQKFPHEPAFRKQSSSKRD